MARGREDHVYVVDSKTGELFAPERVTDGEMELVHGVLDGVEEGKSLLDYAEQEYGQDRAMRLNVYKDGKKQVDGTEYFTTQAGFDQFSIND